ncbi:hypothetical protein GYMLUDRAFT_35400 [Collybiopsis luxurians FD-317 M1]|nr:hypothetical protein GYMLUDRAFT_35400 [Collybiopsis luxurians FD-317 M1]
MRVTIESAFEGARDFTIEHAEFNHNTYQGWNTSDLDAIRKWLNAADPSNNFNSAIEKKTPGTGEWILEDETYLEWKDNGGRLWIQGKVGTGKTVLS